MPIAKGQPREWDVVCTKCGRKYHYVVKEKGKPHKGHTRTVCNSCMVNERRFAKREQLVREAGGKCERCGYDRYPGALHFHHLDEENKLFNISGSHGYSLGALQEEVKKCVLVCANCHAELHASII